MARCFECNGVHEVSGTAHSTLCRDCGAYIDLQDYKITTSFSRNIITRGTVFLAQRGDLSSSKIVCSGAALYGRMRGNIICSGKVVLKMRGRFPGTLEAGCLLVEKGSEVEFARPVKVAGLDILGAVRGNIVSAGHVSIHKSGLLSGTVRARGFMVEKGGCFEGELTICPDEAFSASLVAGGAETPAIEPARRLWPESSSLINQEPLPN